METEMSGSVPTKSSPLTTTSLSSEKKRWRNRKQGWKETNYSISPPATHFLYSPFGTNGKNGKWSRWGLKGEEKVGVKNESNQRLECVGHRRHTLLLYLFLSVLISMTMLSTTTAVPIQVESFVNQSNSSDNNNISSLHQSFHSSSSSASNDILSEKEGRNIIINNELGNSAPLKMIKEGGNDEKERMTRSIDSSSFRDFSPSIEEVAQKSGSEGYTFHGINGNSGNNGSNSQPIETAARIGCASPEVLVNGSPSPEIVETVGGGSGRIPPGNGSGSSPSGFGNIEEIQFVGIIGSNSESPNRRICRIKCVNGVWVGPLCTLEKGPEVECPAIDPFLDPSKHVATKIPSLTTGGDGLQSSMDSSDGNSGPSGSSSGNMKHKVNDRVHFSCLEGFTLSPNSGPSDIICNSNGQWSPQHPPSPPSCIPMECSRPESDDPNLEISDTIPTTTLDNSKTTNQKAEASITTSFSDRKSAGLKQTFEYGSKIYFSCKNGYKLNSQNITSESTCSGVNTWSPSAPSCQEITCPQPLPPVNGKLLDSGRFNVGDYVEFMCNEGHIMIGDPLAICSSNGSWSIPTPQCRAICEFPGEPKNGYISPTKFSYDIGDEITIMCKSSQRPHPTIPFLYCNQDGKWSHPLPSCSKYILDEEVDDGDSIEYS